MSSRDLRPAPAATSGISRSEGSSGRTAAADYRGPEDGQSGQGKGKGEEGEGEEEELSPLEQEVLDEYASLAGNLGRVSFCSSPRLSSFGSVAHLFPLSCE